jgi:hypothetical protein
MGKPILDADVFGDRRGRNALLLSEICHAFGGDFGPRDAGGFADERDGVAGARVDFEDVNGAAFTANCTFIRPQTFSSTASFW